MVAWIECRGGSTYLVIGWRAVGRLSKGCNLKVRGEGIGERVEAVLLVGQSGDVIALL